MVQAITRVMFVAPPAGRQMQSGGQCRGALTDDLIGRLAVRDVLRHLGPLAVAPVARRISIPAQAREILMTHPRVPHAEHVPTRTIFRVQLERLLDVFLDLLRVYLACPSFFLPDPKALPDSTLTLQS